ncbi:MAG: prepilin-type N-terminal cleavage/methylation domain-containing protein [Planctomycetota bacterium]|nr:prepilin-type N-terminal cleavage/methylation domain-containing protein [Planctomycetota bacterium]
MAGSFHPPLPNTSTDSIRRARRGLTLIEMLIAVVLTLIVVFALVRVFQMLGDNVRDTKAILEMSGQLRTFLSQLQEDLDSRTVTVRSYADPEAAPGYFELIEGIATDRDVDGDGQIPLDGDGDNLLNSLLPVATFTQVDPMNRADADFHPVIDSQGNPVTDSQGNPRNAMTTKGDRDDVLMFTVRTSGKPFSGQLIGSLVFNSPQALNKCFINTYQADHDIRSSHKKRKSFGGRNRTHGAISISTVACCWCGPILKSQQRQ